MMLDMRLVGWPMPPFGISLRLGLAHPTFNILPGRIGNGMKNGGSHRPIRYAI
jgi:hypothetical protein